ncbi:hypothetical protein, partial [Phaeovulum sp.]|uniref:hypothetical protein n=1 Tax=Phaeovulum sp. TaxID=2934796 RepID=UPI003564E5B4
MKLDTTEPSFSGAVIARERAEAGHSSSAFLDAALIGIPATAVHVLQPILTPFLGAPEALYFGPEAAWPEIGISGSLRLSEAGRCSTDAYFNAFFLDFWRAHTSLTRLGVVCHAQGALTLRAIVHLANGRREVLAEWHHKGQGAEAPYWLWSRAGEV